MARDQALADAAFERVERLEMLRWDRVSRLEAVERAIAASKDGADEAVGSRWPDRDRESSAALARLEQLHRQKANLAVQILRLERRRLELRDVIRDAQG